MICFSEVGATLLTQEEKQLLYTKYTLGPGPGEYDNSQVRVQETVTSRQQSIAISKEDILTCEIE